MDRGPDFDFKQKFRIEHMENAKRKLSKRKIDTEPEKKIIIGLISDDTFCHECLPLVKTEYFLLDYARPIIRWIKEYYEKYEVAPKKDIQAIFTENEKKTEKSLLESIAFFLDKLSREYQSINFNSQYQIDLAKKYFKERALRIQTEKINKLLDAGKVDEALEINELDVITDSGLGSFYNPFEDQEIKSYISEDDKGGVMRMPGVLGDLLGNFNRNNLIVFSGSEKKGKTSWLQECVFQALNHNLNVAWFSFEMNKQQTKERVYSMVAAMTSEPVNEIVFPVFDCKHNQTGNCYSKKRKNQINNLLSGLEAGKLPNYYDFPNYNPCTECRGTREFETAVWFSTQKDNPILDYRNLSKKAIWLKGNGNLRIKNYPAFSAGAEEMRRDIKELIASGFIPDVIITDYLDIQRREPSSSEREGIHKIWQQAKRLTAEYNVVHITADQADAAARTQKSLKQTNFSDDKRKDGVLDIKIGLNQTDEEKEQGIMRLNVLYKRMGKAIITKEVMVLQCLDLGQVCLDSEWV